MTIHIRLAISALIFPCSNFTLLHSVGLYFAQEARAEASSCLGWLASRRSVRIQEERQNKEAATNDSFVFEIHRLRGLVLSPVDLDHLPGDADDVEDGDDDGHHAEDEPEARPLRLPILVRRAGPADERRRRRRRLRLLRRLPPDPLPAAAHRLALPLLGAPRRRELDNPALLDAELVDAPRRADVANGEQGDEQVD